VRDRPALPVAPFADVRASAGLAIAIALATTGCGQAGEASTQVAKPAPSAAAPAVATPSPPLMPVDPVQSAGFDALGTDVIGPHDTIEDVRARVEGANVRPGKVPGAEGEELDGWLVYPDDPERRLYVYLDDARTHPAAVRVLDPESRWQRADGIRMGLTLAELARRNGAPVKFMGFDWDYGGGIIGWNGGRFEREPSLGGITVCPPPAEGEAGPDYPMGEQEFDSDNAWVRAHPPTVCEFGLALEAAPAPAKQDAAP
jgi:hypothetical protein